MGEIVGNVTEEYLLKALDDVFKEHFNLVKVSNVTTSPACGKGDNYFGIIHRVKVSGIGEDGEDTQLSVILKIPPFTVEMREKLPVTKLFVREAFIYNVTIPTLCALQENKGIQECEQYKNLLCYKTGIELNKEFLIMQDGCSQNFFVPPRTTAFDNTHCWLILKNLAKFHALSFVLKKEDPNKFLQITKYTGGIDDFEEKEYQEILDHLVKKCSNAMTDNDLKNVLEKYTEGLYEKTLAYASPEAVDGYAVLTHADCWTNNILIKYEDERPTDCRLIDWQTLCHASPIIDLSFFVLNCTDEETRNEHLTNWIEFYYNVLSEHIERLGHSSENLYPREIFDEHFKRVFLFGLAMSFVMLPATVGDPNDALNIDDAVSDESRQNMSLDFSSKSVAKRIGIRLEGIIRTCLKLSLLEK